MLVREKSRTPVVSSPERLSPRASVDADGYRARAIEIRHDGEYLEVAGVKAPLSLGPARRLDLRVFLDRSILEVYANGAVCVTRAVYPDGSDDGLAAFAEGAPEKAEVSVWPMKTAW